MRKIILALAMAFASLVGLTGVAHAWNITDQPTYYPNSNPTLASDAQICFVDKAQFNAGHSPCYRWVRFGGGYEQGTESKWINEAPLTAVWCSFGYFDPGVSHWHWVYVGSGPSAPFCTAGSPTPFYNRD
jgi:hypothetical protein